MAERKRNKEIHFYVTEEERKLKISESLVNAVMREQAKGCWAWPKMGMRFGWGLKQPPHGL